MISKEDFEEIWNNSIEMITQDCNRYYFYLPEAGDLEVQMNGDYKFIGGYNSSGNVVIEAGYSSVNYEERKIHRARLFSITGYYDKNGNWIGRPECIKKLYDKLVRTVKKLAPYTEFVDEIQVSCPSSEDYMKTREWKHKEYITKELSSLKENDDYKIGM